MARPLRVEHPYLGAVEDTLNLAKRQPGWNSYDAESPTPAALLGAIDLLFSLASNIDHSAPLPAVGSIADGAVLLRWMTPDRQVEIVYTGRGQGDFTVTHRGDRKVLAEGSLGDVDPMKDVVNPHVLGLGVRSRW